MSPMCGAREEITNEKTTFYKVWFFRGLPILASMSPMWGAREEVTNEKTTFYKAWFFRGLPILAPTSAMWGAREEVTKGGGNKRKNHALQSVVFSWFAHTCLYVTHEGGKGGGNKRKKTRFTKCGFFVVCPYLPLCHPCVGQGRR